MDGSVKQMRAERAREVGRRWPGRSAPTLLLVGIEEAELSGLRSGLATSMHLVSASSALAALARFTAIDPDAVLLGGHISEVDPTEWIRALREVSAVPIVVGMETSAVDMAGDLLMAGATAIVQHPFDCDEILGRFQEWRAAAVRRRTHELRLEVGPLELDSAAFTVRLRGRVIPVTLKEFELLRCLMKSADRVVMLDEIHHDLWGDGPEAPSLDAIKLHVRKLRRNLGDPSLVMTVRGQGYTVNHLREDANAAL